MKKVILTGANGFVGHHILEHFLKKTDWEIYCLDKLSYASSGHDRIRDINVFNDDRVKIFTTDLCLPFPEGVIKELGDISYIFHVAAESHVDNSISDPVPFVQNNVNSTLNILEYAKSLPNLEKFIYFSTDEVYGSAPVGKNYQEGERFNCGNPYSASKGAAECICQAYANTYKMPIVITNTMNVIGERQHPEKYIPKVVKKVLNGETVTIHSNKEKTKAGSRFYIHARNIADALLHILYNCDENLDNYDSSKGRFNIVGEKETDNLELAQLIAKILGKELKYEMVDFHSQRPGHDLRYALDGGKMKSLGWEHPVPFEESLENTINWTLEKREWLDI
jgi:dTDP-glucose 4,6-dehydratase|tara:strand:+ start:121 stop:1131 length:1011 start_codon:yes stop_codon:yes gene_type:complete